MGFEVELIAFSENPDGNKLATYLINPPRSIQAEILRHRSLSFSAVSSRAIPTKRMLERFNKDLYIPEFGLNCSGMAVKNPMDEIQKQILQNDWIELQKYIAEWVTKRIDVEDKEKQPHKGDINRVLESGMFMELIVSGTEWNNFFFQRVHEAAHPAFQEIAYKMAKLYFTTEPKKLEWGEWHLPFVTQEDIYTLEDLTDSKVTEYIMSLAAVLSTARCGRVSYSKHDKKDVEEDLKWYNKHIYENAVNGQPQHVSPAEHPAIAKAGKWANFNGFQQLRYTIPGENHSSFTLEDLNKYEEKTGRNITLDIKNWECNCSQMSYPCDYCANGWG